jgi:hypothetical protein
MYEGFELSVPMSGKIVPEYDLRRQLTDVNQRTVLADDEQML